MTLETIGIDLGKTVFHLIGMDQRGEIVMKKRLSRTQLVTLLANTPPCLIGMEASCGSHHLGRELTKFGHDVRFIPAQFVKPFVKSHKNDYVDAEAIAEAVQRPTMRFVPIKTEDQLDLHGVKVTDYAEGDPVAERKLDYEPYPGPRPELGYFGLQNDSKENTVYFREVAIKKLPAGNPN